MRKFAIGDIHGNYKALIQCLERSNFNYQEDKLIVLGDVCDGWTQVKECFDELLKIKHLVYILGNHDEWALDWFDLENREGKELESLWVDQGGMNTLKSYGTIVEQKVWGTYGSRCWVCVHDSPMPKKHLDILKTAKLYHVEDNNLFTHAGIDERRTVEETNRDVFLWDRDLFKRCYGVHHYNPNFKIQHYDTIFIGHTTVQWLTNDTKPVFACNLINLDTGAGWDGKLTIMDVKTKEYWQSDLAKELYPNIKGR